MSIKEKLEALVAQTEKNNVLVHKRAELVKELKLALDGCKKELKTVMTRHNRESYYTRDAIVQMKEQLKDAIKERDHYAVKLQEIENSFGLTYDSFKDRLNRHYYTLQQAFNNFVKSKSIENVKIAGLEASLQAANMRMNDLEQKMLDMFFNE
jgi:ABC-type Zn uptake system ZnuABC Zn-binding protein ZnuA